MRVHWIHGAIAGILALGAAACSDDEGSPVDGDCVPDCAGLTCGSDGCGGFCGVCVGDMFCVAGQCTAGDVGGPTDTAPDTDTSAPLDPAADGDQDGVPNGEDNCPGIFNPDQGDLDEDRLGDGCDNDVDGDGDDNVVDCAPRAPTVGPSAPELCNNGVDDDCDDTVDEEDASDCEGYYIDTDGDGAGVTSTRRCLCGPDGDHVVVVAGDCDDGDASRGPLQPEVCDNIDNDCNTLIDEGCDDDGDGYCDDAMVLVGASSACPLGGGDCYDYSALVSPAATEIEGDGLDNDCDGEKAGEQVVELAPDCPANCVGGTEDAFLCAAEICYPDLVLLKSVASLNGTAITNHWGGIQQWGSPSNDLAPIAGNSYAMLGTGNYLVSDHDASPGGTAFGGIDDPFDPSPQQMYDAIEFRVVLKAPPGATGFSLDYIFMSAEYEEFIGDIFNDRFYIIMKAPQTTGNQPTIINFTNCSKPNEYSDFVEAGQAWCYIAINTAFSEPCNNPVTDISGTGHECGFGSSTGWLSTSWPINANEQFELTFHIHDTADSRWNSHVLLDNFRWEGGVFTQGTFSQN